MRTVIRSTLIRRDDLRLNPDRLFLFGDNLEHKGLGGQAKEMRGEPNAIGIPTKKKPDNALNSFFTDDEYVQNVKYIDAAFEKIPENCIVVLPDAGLGTGLARLPEKAPKTFAYLEKKLDEL